MNKEQKHTSSNRSTSDPHPETAGPQSQENAAHSSTGRGRSAEAGILEQREAPKLAQKNQPQQCCHGYREDSR